MHPKQMSQIDNIRIRELNLDDIRPNTEMLLNGDTKKLGGSKICMIGKPGTGKSTIISSILYAKKHILPVGLVMCGTESTNHFYQKIMPSTFIYNEYDEEILAKFLKRQRLAKEYLANPWAAVNVDDCTSDKKVFNHKIQKKMFKDGRHYSMLYILSLQWCLDIPPDIRQSMDGVFILREASLKVRRRLWEHYAGIVPDFATFCALMDQLTEDYHCIYIANNFTTNDWTQCVFYYKAKIPPPDFKFGCSDYWEFHEQRYNHDYVVPYDQI